MAMIKVDHLTKSYGFQKGIFDLNFTVNEGEVVGFLGPNGAGKTTTIRHLLGFIKNHTGKAYINSLDSDNDQIEIQKIVGYLPGEISFIDDLDGYQLLKLLSDMRGIKDLSYAHELFKLFDLNPKQPIKKMSKGMKQKLGIVIAFYAKPKLLILDEPSTGLDPLMQQKLVDLIIKHKKEGATIFLSSHIFEEVEKTCDRVIMIKHGLIVADQSISSIKEQTKKVYEITFETDTDLKAFEKTHQVHRTHDLVCTYELTQSLNELLKDLSTLKVKDITRKELALEEIFMQYYGE